MSSKDLLRKLGTDDFPIVQSHTCAPEGYLTDGEGGNIDQGLLGGQASVKVLCSEASTANFISESAYLMAKSKNPGAFKDLGEQKYRPGVDKVRIMSLYGGSEVLVKSKVEVPLTYSEREWKITCLLVEKLFGGVVDVVLGAPFYNDHVEKSYVDADGAKTLIFYEDL